MWLSLMNLPFFQFISLFVFFCSSKDDYRLYLKDFKNTFVLMWSRKNIQSIQSFADHPVSFLSDLCFNSSALLRRPERITRESHQSHKVLWGTRDNLLTILTSIVTICAVVLLYDITIDPISPNSRSKSKFSFQFIASYVYAVWRIWQVISC